MTRSILVVALLALFSCREAAGGNSFDRAIEAAGRAEFRKAAELYADAAKTDADPVRRAKAEIRLANIEWRVFRQHDAARTRLQRVAAGEHEVFMARIELARAALDRKDGPAARADAREAMKAAKTRRDRRRAAMAMARVILDTKHDTSEIRDTIASLRAVVEEAGPMTEAARMLAKAALIAGDGAAAMEAIDGYYHVSKFSAPPNAIAAAHAELARVLPSWRGADETRPAIARGLVGIRFFEEAALVSREPIPYARMVERAGDLIDAYYRDLANDDEDHGALKKGIDSELRALWATLSNEKYDRKRAEAELARRFGTYLILGETGGFRDVHFGHVVVDRTLPIEQYGRTATMRFVALDSMVSNGFGTFLSDGSGGDGGWATEKEIYQVRPPYANAPLYDWQLLFDEETRAEEEREMVEESARDRERAKTRPLGPFPGLAKRLHTQYLNGLRGLPRDEFLARVEKEAFQYSILLHEGRHAIDKLSKEMFKTWELEYRAKLSQIALADTPRDSLQSIVETTIGGDSPHGKANEQLMKGMLAWMEANRAAIAGLDPALPLVPQMDKLTDEQMRAVVRGLDPLVR